MNSVTAKQPLLNPVVDTVAEAAYAFYAAYVASRAKAAARAATKDTAKAVAEDNADVADSAAVVEDAIELAEVAIEVAAKAAYDFYAAYVVVAKATALANAARDTAILGGVMKKRTPRTAGRDV